MLPVLLIALPLVAALPCYLVAKRRLSLGYALLIAVTGLELLAAAWLLYSAQDIRLSWPAGLGLGLSFHADGFRALYASIACLMWLLTSLLTPEYLAHGHSKPRYLFYTLLTMGATLGVFLSDDLITALVFFEIMSFTSYAWVAHEQNPGALRAGQTYLAIAVLGGMAMLMGLMMMKAQLGSLALAQLPQLAKAAAPGSLYLPGALILVGFGAKAGVFPLHVWLPKAHPVAPAPASALLSGILTKVGVFGILVLATRVFLYDQLWASIMLALGLINMLLGATLALFSIDLKRTLACSSVSQIGFILFGIGSMGLLREHNALAAQGTLLHMMNHSLIKLCLFMAAGVIYMRLHQLNLNDIRGFGRGRYGLMLCFLAGGLSLSGVPLFSGYASKTLLHEGLLEYIAHLQAHGLGSFWYQAAEWGFVLAGGLTFCYMLKLFIAIFVEKHPQRQEEYRRMGPSMGKLSSLALGLSALVIFGLGLRPDIAMQPLANLGLPFMAAHAPDHAVPFLAMVNVLGAAKSLIIGLLLYLFLVRRWLIKRDEQGNSQYVNRWPAWLDLEDSLYRPLLKRIKRLGFLVAIPLDRLMDGLQVALLAVGTFVARLLESLVDGFSLLLMRSLFSRQREEVLSVPVGNRLTYGLGRGLDTLSYGIDRIFRPHRPYTLRFIFVLSSAWEAAGEALRRMLRTLSFGLMLFAVGFVLLLAYLMTR